MEQPGSPPSWSISMCGSIKGQIHWIRNHSNRLLKNGVSPRFRRSSSDKGRVLFLLVSGVLFYRAQAKCALLLIPYKWQLRGQLVQVETLPGFFLGHPLVHYMSSYLSSNSHTPGGQQGKDVHKGPGPAYHGHDQVGCGHPGASIPD